MKLLRALAPVLLIVAALAAVPVPAGATDAGASPAPVIETPVGALAAAGCGLGIRYFGVVMAYGVGGAMIVVSLCALAFFDALADP